MSRLRQEEPPLALGTGGLADALRRCLAAYAAGQPLLLLFDYDGTLAPLRPRPEQARMPAPTRRSLARLARRPRVTVGIISGRSLGDLQQMCLLEGIVYVGTGGLEWEMFGSRGVHPRAPEVRGAMAALNRQLAQVLVPFGGAWIENKRWALTVHYRQVPGEQVPSLLETVKVAVASQRSSVRLVSGPKALEIYPELGWDKGNTVRWLAAQMPGRRPLVLYAGDAANDQPALDAVQAMGGVPVAVGPEVHAPYWASGPEELYELLASLDTQLPWGDPTQPATPQPLT